MTMGWLRLVGSLKLYVSFAKEPYKRDDILQKRPMILRSLLIVATPYLLQHTAATHTATERRKSAVYYKACCSSVLQCVLQQCVVALPAAERRKSAVYCSACCSIVLQCMLQQCVAEVCCSTACCRKTQFCSVLQCVYCSACCSSVLQQCIAVCVAAVRCSSVLQHNLLQKDLRASLHCIAVRVAAVCCSECCSSVLQQCIAAQPAGERLARISTFVAKSQAIRFLRPP